MDQESNHALKASYPFIVCNQGTDHESVISSEGTTGEGSVSKLTQIVVGRIQFTGLSNSPV